MKIRCHLRISFIIAFVQASFMSSTCMSNTTWGKLIGNDSHAEVGDDIESVGINGFITSGHEIHFTETNQLKAYVRIRKVKLDGEIEWESAFGRAGVDTLGVCRRLKNGGYLAAGGTKPAGAIVINGWLVKLDNGGKIMWQKEYCCGKESWFNDICELSDGSFAVIGAMESSVGDSFPFRVFLLRVDRTGNLVWARAIGNGVQGPGFSIKATSDGNIVLCGTTFSTGINDPWDLWVAKFDRNGNVLWQKSYGSGGSLKYGETGNQITELPGGNLVVVGSRAVFKSGGYSLFIELNPNGQPLWAKVLSSGNISKIDDETLCVTLLKNGEFLILNQRSTSESEGLETWILCLSKDAKIVWQLLCGQPKQDTILMSAIETADNEIVAYGYTTNGTSESYRALMLQIPRSGVVGDQCPNNIRSAHGLIKDVHLQERTPLSSIFTPKITIRQTHAMYKVGITSIKDWCSN